MNILFTGSNGFIENLKLFLLKKFNVLEFKRRQFYKIRKIN